MTCAAAGVDSIGINFFSNSRRYQPFQTASTWLDRVPEQLVRTAVFVNAPEEEVRRIAASGLIDVLQFHGTESPDYCARMRSAGLPIIKAVPIRDESDLEKLPLWEAADALLLDAWAPGVYGGTGQTIDWTLAARAVSEVAPKPVILSGGLNPSNVQEAVKLVRPAAVDTASGVERAPGFKDPDKCRAFAAAVRRVVYDAPPVS